MGVNHSAVLGVGVDDSEITYETLTEFAKGRLRNIFEDSKQYRELEEEYCDEDGEWLQSPVDIINDALKDYYEEAKHGEDFLYDLGLTEIEANCYSGWYGYRGVGINLNIETIKEDVNKAVQEFKKVVNLEPILFTGVLVS